MSAAAPLADLSRPRRPGESPLAQRLAARLVGSGWFWAIFIAIGFTVPLVRTVNRALPTPPPVVGPFPEFALTDQEGHAFGSDALQGKLSVVEFVSPEALEAGTVSPLAALQKRVRNAGPAVHLVSFVRARGDGRTMDAVALGALGAGAHAGPWRWTLGSGASAPSLESEVRRRFGAGATVGTLLLVDDKLRVRRVVTSSRENVDLLMRDIGILLNLPDNPPGEPTSAVPLTPPREGKT